MIGLIKCLASVRESTSMFLWDEANLLHIAKHGVTRAEAEEVMLHRPLDIEIQLRGGEKRMLQLGETRAGRELFVIVTKRVEDVRVVTAFPADKKARKFYAHHKGIGNVEETRDP